MLDDHIETCAKVFDHFLLVGFVWLNVGATPGTTSIVLRASCANHCLLLHSSCNLYCCGPHRPEAPWMRTVSPAWPAPAASTLVNEKRNTKESTVRKQPLVEREHVGVVGHNELMCRSWKVPDTKTAVPTLTCSR